MSAPLIAPTSTTLAQDQATALNQGKPGYDVLGNSVVSSGDAQVLDNQKRAAALGVSIPGVSPTTISGDKSKTISDNTTQVNNIANSTRGMVTGADSFERYSNGDWANAPSDALATTDESGRTVWQSGGKSYYLAPDTPENMNPADKESRDMLDRIKSQTDAAFANQISGVKAAYDNLIQLQGKVNAGAEAGTNALLLKGGAYHTASGEGIQSAQIGEGIQKISDLQVKENEAVSSLISAQASKDYEIVNKQLDLIAKIKADKQKTVNDLNDKLTTAKKEIQTELNTKNNAIDTSIRSAILDAKKNGATSDELKAMNDALSNHDYTAAINAAGDKLQTMTGDFADYPQYKKDALASGITPMDATAWLAHKQKVDAQNKESLAYGTAFNSALGKAAGEAKAGGNESTLTYPVTSPKGLVYSAPASIAPYVNFSNNGVKYVDLSKFLGTPTEAEKAGKDAIKAGYRVITDKNQAVDVKNIADANAKLSDMKEAFEGIGAKSALERDSYAAAITIMAKKLQTDPNATAADVYQDAALDILKAMSGTQGFRGGANMIASVQKTFPSITDTKAVIDQKITNMTKLLDDREEALVGKPNTSDQALIDQKNQEDNITTSLNDLKTTNPKLYSVASNMYLSNNPDTGQPYTAADILQAFPELKK